ncbi:hypothetical protein C0Q72_07965 [Klebsiella pneumoniae]|nr:hypothetical protein [Klebsiella pneumoniae]MBX4494568.1 hypothetical protein [Klebsiella pneumoniae]MBX4681659.1 hypothetical protein [Klebsiella pneumoniae]
MHGLLTLHLMGIRVGMIIVMDQIFKICRFRIKLMPKKHMKLQLVLLFQRYMARLVILCRGKSIQLKLHINTFQEKIRLMLLMHMKKQVVSFLGMMK